jgi:hypothetical protein
VAANGEMFEQRSVCSFCARAPLRVQAGRRIFDPPPRLRRALRLRDAESDNPKFVFLKPDHPFHAYFRAKARAPAQQRGARRRPHRIERAC